MEDPGYQLESQGVMESQNVSGRAGVSIGEPGCQWESQNVSGRARMLVGEPEC